MEKEKIKEEVTKWIEENVKKNDEIEVNITTKRNVILYQSMGPKHTESLDMKCVVDDTPAKTPLGEEIDEDTTVF